MNIINLLASDPGTLLAGFGLGLSLIVAIGAQNAYVLRQGARREHLIAVLLVCIVSDVILITAGIAGFGTLLDQAPWVITAMRWGGVAFLLGYGVLAARRAWRPSGRTLGAAGHTPDDAPGAAELSSHPVTVGATSGVPDITATITAAQPKTVSAPVPLTSVVLTALALTWLNPHVYLDTVVLLGSVANTHGADGRWVFALGACVASVLWFTALGFGSRLLANWLASPRSWRILDAIIAAIMLSLAASLAFSS